VGERQAKGGLPQWQEYGQPISDSVMKEVKCAPGKQGYLSLVFISWNGRHYFFNSLNKLLFINILLFPCNI
jgi:hypothetical protein